MPTAATFSLISSAIFAFSRLRAVYLSIGVALAVGMTLISDYFSPAPAFLLFSDEFATILYLGSGLVIDFPFF